EVLLALVAGGHVLLEGVPGIGKTLLVRTLARSLRLTFRRIQFTPDLMPADVLGTHILEELPDGRRGFRFEPGPIFGHLVLADEVNRATPKTQSALLEAMEERSVTVSGETHPLTEPFMVLATQNPIEMEGTYPLPEAQLDRFLFKICLGIEGVDQIVGVIDRTTGTGETEITPVGGAEDVLRLRRIAREVVLADHLKEFVARLVMATHPDHPEAPERVKRFVKWGASPRGAQAVILAAKVLALTRGHPHVGEEDLRDVAFPALRHRLILSFEGEAEGIGGDDVLEQVLERVRA
ncbi:MAG: AAA family ATPase, partial [Planctomycetes bacterium]|nr:AAA family ATPase [Planctomycetota bacterium]